MRILFAGGGTGGHIYPAVAIADAVRARDGAGARIAFVGTADRLEARLVPQAGYPLHCIAARPLRRDSIGAALGAAFVNGWGVLQALGVLLRERPEIVVATGGYVCFPLVVAARALRTLRVSRAKIALLEPNAQPGLTNRLLAPFVDEVWGALPKGDPRFGARYRCTGVPIRGSLRSLPPRATAIERLGLDPQRRTLLAMGGSQGARSLNDALVGAIAAGLLPTGWQVLHLTGEREYDRVRARLPAAAAGALRPYLDDPADAFAVADLVLARAGASTLAELIALALPAILVPYPHAAEGHQSANARALEGAGAAVTIADEELTAASLGALLARICAPEALARLRAAIATLRTPEPTALILARIATLAGRNTQT